VVWPRRRFALERPSRQARGRRIFERAARPGDVPPCVSHRAELDRDASFRLRNLRDRLRPVRPWIHRSAVAIRATLALAIWSMCFGCTTRPVGGEPLAARAQVVEGSAVIEAGAYLAPTALVEDAATGIRKQVIENTEIRALDPGPDGRAYQLYVALPSSYAERGDKHYPVLYLCDGYWDFALVNAFYGNLFYDKVIPEYILVGFGYQGKKPDYDRLRRWDYTPVPDTRPDGDAGVSGHAADFLATVEHEIIPFVEREYRVDSSYRVLAGSSLGGLFTLYAALAKPGLFQAYIAPSPAVVWAGDWLFGYEEAFAKSGQHLRGRLFMTGAGNEWPSFLDGIRRFDARLRGRAHPDLVYEFRVIDGERHAGTKAESYNRGVRFAFAPLVGKEAGH
jgi:uncharacterized protein